MKQVRMRIVFPKDYDEKGVEKLIDDKFPDEADLWYNDRAVTFLGLAERGEELLRALNTIGEYRLVRRQDI